MTRVARLLVVLALVLPGVALAADWPQFRGPNRDGKSAETGLLDKWPDSGPTLVWQIKDLGKGYAGVAVVGDTLYTMGDREGEQLVLAYDLTTQKQRWATRVGRPWGDSGRPGPRCIPTVADGLVYVVGTDGDLVCVQATDGKEVWRKSLTKDLGGKMSSVWGYSESPLIDGDWCVVTPGAPDAAMAALHKKTGEVVWKTAAGNLGPKGKDGAGYASITISNGAGVKQYVTLTGRGMIGVDAKTGKLLWNYNRVANGVANIPTAIVKDDLVFCSSGYQTGAALLKLSKDGEAVKADEVYWLDAKTFQNHHGNMILVGDHVYAGHGHNAGLPICIELATGKIAWKAPEQPGRGSAGVTYAEGNIYFRSENGDMCLIAASPTAYDLKGRFKLASVLKESWPHPVIAGGKLYLRDQEVLMCYDIAKK